MQSSLWAKQKPEWRWRAVVSTDGAGGIRGSLALLIRRVPGTPFTLMYGCRGPVCSPADAQALRDLTDGARALARQYRSCCVKLDPDVPSSDTAFADALSALGFRAADTGKDFGGFQPRYVFRLELEGKTEDGLLASFHAKTRYNIRLAARRGVEVRICGEEAADEFSRLMEITGRRDGFLVRNADYFRLLLKNFGPGARLYMAYHQGKAIAGTLAVRYGDKVWYLYGASSDENRELMPNYLLQWSMICWAVESGCRIYDFRGVSGDLSPENPLYGLYKFKKGFGGDFTEFVGEQDLVLCRPAYEFARAGIRLARGVRGPLRGLGGGLRERLHR